MNNKTDFQGTSLMVLQFVEILRGDVERHTPQNEFVTVAVEAKEYYCLKCFTDGLWDVWHGRHDGLEFKLGRCQACGEERTL